MQSFRKTVTKKNTAGKITALLCLLSGAALVLLAGQIGQFVALAQLLGVGLLGASIYIASAYLLRVYTFSVEPSGKAGDELPLEERYDFLITERKGNRDVKVCHLGLGDITNLRVVDPENKKQILEERKNKKRFTYNTEYAASRQIEVAATIDDEDYSILITYDEELFRVLKDLLP